ncbi:bifunctional hydroxymethylpyrimidine kinase/phosphomethylpyrimidine kinase [Rubrivirga sp.]|uniref:bifunctional hydroxymethylpyrimidine kinase/phosphomethylpyrimidine kinase n=1 Tax=Rubrivirga sp. TaxID=1885344 RepID=UPI003C775ADC
MSLLPVCVIGSAYTGSERGISADVLASRALGLAPRPVYTSIVVASDSLVSDVTDVPVDTVIAQLDHVLEVGPVAGVKIGILGGPKTANAVLEAAPSLGGPVVLDLVASGPSGETVLSARGIDAVAQHLGAADLVTISKADAELVTGGQIESLDDAQVAAQRICNRGAKAVVIRCGSLPYRFYDAADDPGNTNNGDANRLFADLLFDGEDFALFEAPYLDAAPDGASSAFAMAALLGMIQGSDLEVALQKAKRYATDSVRHALEVDGYAPRLDYSLAMNRPAESAS